MKYTVALLLLTGTASPQEMTEAEISKSMQNVASQTYNYDAGKFIRACIANHGIASKNADIGWRCDFPIK